jgi:hypothetical protein
MKHIKISALMVLLLALGLTACLPDKEVDLKLPDYERELVVECFLEPGQPLKLLLFETVGFTDPIDSSSLPFVDDALVIISHNGIHDTLPNSFYFDIISQKFYNYFLPAIVPFDYNTEYSLFIRDLQGREITGTATILPPPSILAFNADFDRDSMANVNIRWSDNPATANYYNFSLHRDRFVEDTLPETDDGLQFSFTLDDRVGNGEDFRLSSFFSWKKGQTAIATVYAIDEGYWRYVETVGEAQSSNGNPFSQPGRIISTVEGGLGVFTGLSYVRDSLLIE